jgi:hypothetical protein
MTLMGRKEMDRKVWLRKSGGKRSLGRCTCDRILQEILKLLDSRAWTVLVWFRIMIGTLL